MTLNLRGGSGSLAACCLNSHEVSIIRAHVCAKIVEAGSALSLLGDDRDRQTQPVYISRISVPRRMQKQAADSRGRGGQVSQT